MPHPQFTDPELTVAQGMQRLAIAVERANSPSRAFARGVLIGFGTAIGATVVAAVLFTALWRLAQDVGLDDALRNAGLFTDR